MTTTTEPKTQSLLPVPKAPYTPLPWKWSGSGGLHGQHGQAICWDAKERGPAHCAPELVEKANQRLLSACPLLFEALRNLYLETADYITLNELGDIHHNASMRQARAALLAAITGAQP